MQLELPDDILFLICDQVRHLPESSAGTLFNCALTGKRLAPLALANLYRHAPSPGDDEELDHGQMRDLDSVVMKWAIMWRSIYLACQGRTLYPYASYLRFVDLRDLTNLIEHDRFRLGIQKYFFKDLSSLLSKSVVEAFGDAILTQNALIEGVSGKFGDDAMERWMSKLPRLRRLELYDGAVLGREKTLETICQRCPYFRELEILFWSEKEADCYLGPFFEKLQAQSLTRLRTISSCGTSTMTALALGKHRESLSDLNLILEPEALSALGDFKACTSLRKLHLELTSNINLQATQLETFNIFSGWLGDCKDLRELTLINIESANNAVVPLLLDESVQLQELTIGTASAPFFTEAIQAFNYALTHQKTLTSLCLWGDGENATKEELDNLIESIAQLARLKKLELRGLMENFEDDHIVRLLLSLNRLEDVFIGGHFVTDETLNILGGFLPNLKRWTIMAPSRFSLAALLCFVDKLDVAGNDGLQLSIDMAAPEHLLTTDEQLTVRSALKAKVGGSFDYTPLREADASDSEDYSD